MDDEIRIYERALLRSGRDPREVALALLGIEPEKAPFVGLIGLMELLTLRDDLREITDPSLPPWLVDGARRVVDALLLHRKVEIINETAGGRAIRYEETYVRVSPPMTIRLGEARA